MEERILDVQEAARYIGCSAQDVHYHARNGELPCVKVKGRRHFRVADLDQLLERYRFTAPPPGTPYTARLIGGGSISVGYVKDPSTMVDFRRMIAYFERRHLMRQILPCRVIPQRF